MLLLKKYFSIILGLLLVSIAFNLFFLPNNFVSGGVSGLSIVVKQIFHVNESVFLFLMNTFLLLISFVFLGMEKTRNTILGSLLFPVFTFLTSDVVSFVSLEIDPFLIALIGGALSGFGYGLIFKQNYTTGGTDILNQLSEKYLKIPMSKSILFVDGTIVLLGCFTFGFVTMIYSLISLILISEISNRTQLGINKNRVLYITSFQVQEIHKYLTELGYDSTIVDFKGGYSKKNGKMLLSSIYEKDYFKVKEGITFIDPNAFIVATNAYELKNANVAIRKSILEN